MKAIFNEPILKRFNLFALPLAIMWSLSNIGGTFLSTSPVEGFAYKVDPFFEIFHFGKKFGLLEHFDGTIHTKTVTSKVLVPYPHRIKAIYRSPSASFIGISDETTTTIVPLNGRYKNVFHLTQLTDTTAIFDGYGKKYRLRLGHDDPLSRQEVITKAVSDSEQMGSSGNEWRTITYQTLTREMNLQAIEKNIDVSQVMVGSKITGFRVNTILPASIFAQLGIMNGDIIQSINNKKLESYTDALVMYSQVPHMRSVRITVSRNNLQKDIVYEIIR